MKTTKRKRRYVTSSEDEELEYERMEDDSNNDDIGVEDKRQGRDDDEEDIWVRDDINAENQKRDEDAHSPASPRKHVEQIKTEGGPTTAEKRAKAKLLRVSIPPSTLTILLIL